MGNDILIFKGATGTFLYIQKYDGRLPPEKTSISIDGNHYQLTIFEIHGHEYLVAHNEPLEEEPLVDAIKQLNISPIQRKHHATDN
jgi:hypothetical protein